MTRDEYLAAWRTEPQNFMYSGDLQPPKWGWAPIAMTRDSDTLTVSNFEFILADLKNRFHESVDCEEYTHWACGWVKSVRVDTECGPLVDAVIEWIEKLEQYPVADEEHWGKLESEGKQAAWTNWVREYLIGDHADFLRDVDGWESIVSDDDFICPEEFVERIKWCAIDHLYESGNEFSLDEENFAKDVKDIVAEAVEAMGVLAHE